MNEIPVIVVLDKTADFDEVRKASESRGLKVVATLPGLGMIKGMIGEERLAELTKVSGVISVEKEREVKLPPRGSPIQ